MTEYRDHAYKRTIVQQMQRILLDRYIASDSPPKETLLCEEVFRSESEVPQGALMEVFEDLQRWENDQRTKMNAFKWRREDGPLPFLKDKDATQPPSAEAKKNGTAKPKRKRKKGTADTEGSGGADG
jgi:hypothetical protein